MKVIELKRQCDYCRGTGMMRSLSSNPDDCFWDICDECQGRKYHVIEVQTQEIRGRIIAHVRDKSLHETSWCFLSALQYRVLFAEVTIVRNLTKLRDYMQSALCERHQTYEEPNGCLLCEEEVAEASESDDDYERLGLRRNDFY